MKENKTRKMLNHVRLFLDENNFNYQEDHKLSFYGTGKEYYSYVFSFVVFKDDKPAVAIDYSTMETLLWEHSDLYTAKRIYKDKIVNISKKFDLPIITISEDMSVIEVLKLIKFQFKKVGLI